MATTDRPRNTPFDGDLRRALLDAAVEFVASDDPAHLSLRSIARQVGVSHAAPKNHFADKTALLTAIAVDGFNGLGEALRDASAIPSPVDAVAAAGAGYVRYAIAHPGHFRVMWRNELLDPADTTLAEAGRATFDALTDLVRLAQQHGWATEHPPDDVAVLAWSAVHGLAQLHLDGPLAEMIDGDIDHLTHTTIDLLRHAFSPASHE